MSGAGWSVIEGDCLEVLRGMAAGSVDCCITSPPYYGLRDYGTAEWEGGSEGCDHIQPAPGPTGNKGNNGYMGTPYKDTCGKCGAVRVDAQIGLEGSMEEYVAALVGVFREVRRVLADHGCVFLNLGDSYNARPGQRTEYDKAGTKQVSNRGSCETASRSSAGLKPKDLCGIPWRVAFALQADGWWLRSDIIWAKGISFCPTYAGSVMPSSDPTKCTPAHEYVFFATKRQRYWSDWWATREAQVRGAAGSELHTGKTGEHQLGRASKRVRKACDLAPA